MRYHFYNYFFGFFEFPKLTLNNCDTGLGKFCWIGDNLIFGGTCPPKELEDCESCGALGTKLCEELCGAALCEEL